MTWTVEDKLAFLFRQPWTIVPEKGDEPGEVILRVKELPAVAGCGVEHAEIERDFWEAMRAVLEAYLHHGDPIPLPAGTGPLPWEAAPQPYITEIRDGVVVEVPAPTATQFEVTLEQLAPVAA